MAYLEGDREVDLGVDPVEGLGAAFPLAVGKIVAEGWEGPLLGEVVGFVVRGHLGGEGKARGTWGALEVVALVAALVVVVWNWRKQEHLLLPRCFLCLNSAHFHWLVL